MQRYRICLISPHEKIGRRLIWRQIQGADVYVGIIGFRYGSPAKDKPELSYTELEFQTATELGIPRLVFLLDEAAVVPLPRDYLSDPKYEQRQQAFRARVKDSGITVGKVGSPDRLEVLLYQALTALEQQVSRNSGPSPSSAASAPSIDFRDFAAIEPDRALEVAQDITDPAERDLALVGIVRGLAEAGELDRALAIVQSITAAAERDRALVEIVHVLAASDPDRARSLAQSISSVDARSRALEESAGTASTHEPGLATSVGARVGSRRGAGNDRVALEDQLNFSDYVNAFVELIRSADTKPPLTIGIFGSWGMGKSFLLDHIERQIRELQGDPSIDMDPRRQRQQWRKLRRRHKRQDRQAKRDARLSWKNGGSLARPPTRRVHVVRFNAWEYSAADSIWRAWSADYGSA